MYWQATKANLAKRRCASSNLRPVCHKEVETVEHMLFDCEWTQAVWFGSMLNFWMEPGAITNVAQWTAQWGADRVFKEAGKEILSKIALIGWYIWKVGDENTMAIADSSRANGKEFGWTPPRVGTFKVNRDASFNWSSTKASAAAILSDSEGHFIDGVVTSFFSATALQAEAYAVRLACCLAQLNRLSTAEFENDNQELIKLCVPETVPPWEIMAVVVDVRSFAKDRS
ncbi:uncharacterized protein LOC114259611 [Camellia sinensis]|uniref:uncharacterized protein LOC114259611 n=1 Tax=Camellia sinensis TaxID=4442 RepID=UPI0010360128|nr:uncharacterized protein LOC114259611 [Camellia sinensis]